MAKPLNTRPQRPQVSKAELRKRLDPYESIAKKRKINSNNKRVMKRKNYRKPPKKRQRIDRPFSRRSSESGSDDGGRIDTDDHGSSDSSDSSIE
jgi:hypothetical protein